MSLMTGDNIFLFDISPVILTIRLYMRLVACEIVSVRGGIGLMQSIITDDNIRLVCLADGWDESDVGGGGQVCWPWVTNPCHMCCSGHSQQMTRDQLINWDLTSIVCQLQHHNDIVSPPPHHHHWPWSPRKYMRQKYFMMMINPPRCSHIFLSKK